MALNLTTGRLIARNRQNANATQSWMNYAHELEVANKNLQSRLDTQNGLVEEANDLISFHFGQRRILMGILFLLGRELGVVPKSNIDGELGTLVKQFIGDLTKEDIIDAMKFGNHVYHSDNGAEDIEKLLAENVYVDNFFKEYFRE